MGLVRGGYSISVNGGGPVEKGDGGMRGSDEEWTAGRIRGLEPEAMSIMSEAPLTTPNCHVNGSESSE